MKIQLAVSHEGFVTTIVAMTANEDKSVTVLYTGTHFEGDSTGTIEVDLSMLTAEIERMRK